jgi:hypothetical protein
MAYYVTASPSGFYGVTTDQSFDPIGGWFVERTDAIRARDCLRAVDKDRECLYESRAHIADMLTRLRGLIQEYSDHRETRVRACGLRVIADIMQDRLESVTRP